MPMAATQDPRPHVPQILPTETWLQIIHQCAETLSLGEMVKLRRVNRDFNRMAMEAILESDILHNAAYWDPILGETILYDSEDEEGEVFYPPLRESSTDSDFDFDYADYSGLPALYPSDDSDDSEGESELFLDESSQEEDNPPAKLTPSEEFWIMHLTARTMGRTKTKPPTRDHMLLKKVADYIWEWKLRQKTAQDTLSTNEFEDVVRKVCEVATKYGYIYDRRKFFIGNEQPGFVAGSFQLDEPLAFFRDALITVAIYLNDITLLESVLSREYPIPSPEQSSSATQLVSTGKDPEEPPPFKCRVPYEDIKIDGQRKSFGRPTCGRTLIRLGNPTKVSVQTGNIQCASILLQSLAKYPYRELAECRADIVTESSSPDKLDFLRLAIENGPPIAQDQIVLPPLWVSMDIANGHDGATRRSLAGVKLGRLLQSTTSLEVFDLAHAAIMAGYQDLEGVWWTKEPRNYRLTPWRETLSSWGTRRIQRAVLDNCMPIIKRLLQLGYNLGPSYSAAELQEESEGAVQNIIDSQQTRDIALPIAAKSGDWRSCFWRLVQRRSAKTSEKLYELP
ncbi:hypothetical protein FSARC_13514 [Fusarium sarcochroum]|uniref:Uncharacterized protein n=1 Tax=Fusarium sarcochroum TaxID=1208366 RepID=A0A8H4WT44_9HYPO|nr:hypothetical protein FSARC_13514 [Fusarium sarcochroum]